jgi:hypothetical protein
MSESEKLIEVPKRPTSVPEWYYTENGWCGLTKASFLWWSNVVCMVLHLTLGIVTVMVSTSDGSTMATPRLTLYVTNLSWTPNTTDALVPRNQAIDGLYLAHMTLWFFLLSFLAHTTVAVLNRKQAFAANDADARKITRFTGWYFVWLHECRNPLRWLEYSFSASLMGSASVPPRTLFTLFVVLLPLVVLLLLLFELQEHQFSSSS